MTAMGEWEVHELKLPAADIREATILFMFHRDHMYYLKAKWIGKRKAIRIPDDEEVFYIIRQAVEYTVAVRRGQFLVQYKKQQIYTAHRISALFK